MKQLLSARCGAIEPNIATLKLATDIALGNDNIKDVHARDGYKDLILKSFGSHEDVSELYNSLCDNVSKLPPTDAGYWGGAFSYDQSDADVLNRCKAPK